MRTFKRVFKDQRLMDKMLEMRRQGWTYVSLAFLFNVDHSSIYKWCKIRQIPNPTITVSIDVPLLISHYGYKSREIKSYAEYRREWENRNSPLNRLKTNA